ncbi:carbonic anhydrase family protein [Salinimicrobium xinjiangense]|uniref:carbonic anhydrase family protein n=1 Tax=Salinimicrobium xinjiangense TaxID=438596 RepID=UPI00040E34B6|nr:carbonic anhydrase family protein [Salinimicrobium xinjiangense]
MKNFNFLSMILGVSLLMMSCGEDKDRNATGDTTGDTEMTNQGADRNADVTLTQQERDALMPADVVAEFKGGNERFIKDSLTPRNRQARIGATAGAQYPKAMILSCIDSRVPVEEIFDQGLGDLFVGRIAGNFADEEMLGSMEFATKVAGSKVIVVMGHESCGAVKSAIDNVELGNITAMLAHIDPAIEMTNNFAEDQRTVKNEEYVNAVIKNNVKHTIGKIKTDSPIIAEMAENGEINIIGAYYNVDTGAVEWLE